jgi:CheY-like chemotaxis protein
MLKVLVVEDNRAMRSLIKSIIADLAGDVSERGDGAEALSAYAECRPDWVLMDIRMKGLDGISAARQIKAAFPDARIVIVTDFDDPKLREAARSAGAREYVTKENLFDLRRILDAPEYRAAR